jgi:hypothetical protein
MIMQSSPWMSRNGAAMSLARVAKRLGWLNLFGLCIAVVVVSSAPELAAAPIAATARIAAVHPHLDPRQRQPAPKTADASSVRHLACAVPPPARECVQKIVLRWERDRQLPISVR